VEMLPSSKLTVLYLNQHFQITDALKSALRNLKNKDGKNIYVAIS